MEKKGFLKLYSVIWFLFSPKDFPLFYFNQIQMYWTEKNVYKKFLSLILYRSWHSGQYHWPLGGTMMPTHSKWNHSSRQSGASQPIISDTSSWGHWHTQYNLSLMELSRGGMSVCDVSITMFCSSESLVDVSFRRFVVADQLSVDFLRLGVGL